MSEPFPEGGEDFCADLIGHDTGSVRFGRDGGGGEAGVELAAEGRWGGTPRSVALPIARDKIYLALRDLPDIS